MNNSSFNKRGQLAETRNQRANEQRPNLTEATDEQLERLIDRLVDGELNESLRRSLLIELDHRPQGWRRCALAFLEAQAWQSGLGSSRGRREAAEALATPGLFANIFADEPLNPRYAASPRFPVSRFRIAGDDLPERPADVSARIKYVEISPPPRTTQPEREQRPERKTAERNVSPDSNPARNESQARASLSARLAAALRSPSGVLSAMAACFLLAFTLGLAIRGDQSGHNGAGENKLANSMLAGNSSPGGRQSPGNLLATGAGDNQLPAHNQAGDGTWGMVSLANDSSGFQLPVVDGPSMQDWAAAMPPPMSAEMLQELHRAGYEVFTETQWIAVQLDDGRNALVPVDEVQVRYVGGNSIQ